MDKTTNIPMKMGSNNGYNIGGSFGNCNGATTGVIMSNSGKFGKQQQLINCHSIVVPLEEDVDVVSLQHHHIVGASAHQLSSPVHSASSHAKSKDVVAQAMSTRNGHVKNFSSMDHHPTAQNIMRTDVHSAAVQAPLHHFHSSPILHQHHAMVSGNTMGGVVVDGDFAPENSIFRTPTVVAPGSIPPHSYVTSSEPVGQRDSSPPSSSFGEIGGKTFGRKRSRKRPKTCGVCSDRAKSFHFGGLSCDSCKAFFRRSVQNDAHVAFRCAYDSCCDINISTRKSCQFCRFKKCLSIGMEKSWVMTEEERNALNQQRLEKKQSKPASAPAATPTVEKSQQLSPPTPEVSTALSPASSAATAPPPEPIYTFQVSGTSISAESKEPAALAFQESEYVADVDKMLDYMTSDEQQEIKCVVETYLHAYKEMPFRVSFEDGRRDTLEIIEMFTTILRRFAYFAKLIPDFADLDRGDQGNLLRAAVLEMCLLRGAACFDTENNRWPSSTMESLKNCPQLRVEDMQRLVSRELFEMHITFILHMKRLRIDEPIAMLLIMTVLFSPERIPVENKVKVNQSQEKFLMLLKKYVIWKFGSMAGNRVYPQLLTKLSDLRQLNDFHTEFHLNLDSKEVNAIKRSLEELHLNPYPNWKIVPESHQGTPQESPETSPAAAAATVAPQGNPGISMPMMTQALIQRFADRRIPTLLDNPYATFETDLSMIRQVQQTLGSLFPGAGRSSAFPNAQPNTDSENANTRNIHDPSAGRPSSISPRYSSSTDSADAQAFDIMQSSGSQQEYHSPSVGDSSSTSSAHLDSSSILSGEYHADRFQQFLTQNGRTGQEVVSVIKELITPASLTTAQPTSNPGSQQTVLRKHTSSAGSSLPGTPSSVIRSAPARKTEDSTSRVILHHGSTFDAQSVRSINCQMSNNAGWHGGEVHTTTNGHHPGTGNSASVASARAQHPSLYNNDEYNSDEY